MREIGEKETGARAYGRGGADWVGAAAGRPSGVERSGGQPQGVANARRSDTDGE